MNAGQVTSISDTMSTMYVPAAINRSEVNTGQSFAKEMEESKYIPTADTGTANILDTSKKESRENERIDARESNKKAADKNKADQKDDAQGKRLEEKKPHEGRDAKTGTDKNAKDAEEGALKAKEAEDGQNGKKLSAKGEAEDGQNGKKLSAKGEAEEGQNIKKLRAKVAAGGNEAAKQLLRKHEINTAELKTAKDGIKESLSKTHKISANQTAEKIMLKDVKEAGVDETEIRVEVPENATEAELKQEGKLMNELENLKKEGKTDVKPELKIKKTVQTDNSNAFNAAEVNSKEVRRDIELKIKKLLGSNNAEQYEAIKDKIVDRVENSIKFMVAEGERHVSINLHPPELGKVQVELMMKDNQVSAKISAESMAVKEIIMSNLEQLKSNIEEAGIIVDQVDVEVGGFKDHFEQEFSEGNPDGGGGGAGSEGDGAEVKEKDWLPDKVLKQTALSYLLGGTVNYLV
ncbi:MAG: hypothetical protein GY765_39005 [bacterium]|nr:hypothetical protein [bacterium]